MKAARWLSGLLALAAPGLIFTATLLELSRPEPWTPSAAVRAIDQELARAPFGTVVVGPSFARTDIDPAVLQAQLPVEPARVVTLAINGATPPLWYALLKYRVFENGHRPGLILAVVTMESLASVEPLEGKWGELASYVPEPDDTLRRLTYAESGPAWLGRLRARRGTLRDAVVARFRETAARLAGLDGDALEDAGAEVFGEQHASVQLRLPGARPEPVIDAPRPGGTRTSAVGGYLPALGALAEEAGAQLVLVFPPTLSRSAGGQYLEPAVEEELATTAARLGVGWVDLRAEYGNEADYIEGRHMTPAAAARFTALLVERLRALEADGDGPLRPSLRALAPVAAERVGEPDLTLGLIRSSADPCVETVDLADGAPLAEDRVLALPGHHHSPLEVIEGGVLLPQVAAAADLGGRCTGRVWHDGDTLVVHRLDPFGPPLELRLAGGMPVHEQGSEATWWSWPGTTTRWRFDTAPPESGTELRLAIDLVPATPGLAPPELRVGGAVVPLTEQGGHLRGELVAARPSAPWAVELLSPADAAFATIESLRWSDGGEWAPIVSPSRARWVDMLAGAVIRGTPVPAPVPVAPHTSREGAWFDAPWENVSGCSPLALLRDGVALPHQGPDLRPPPVASGHVRHLRRALYVGDEVAGHTWALGRREERACWIHTCQKCGERLWAYPGDEVRATLSPTTRRDRDLVLRWLRFSATSADGSPATQPVRVRLYVGTELRAAGSVPAEQVTAGAEFVVAPALVREYDRPVVVMVDNPQVNPDLLVRLWGGAGE